MYLSNLEPGEAYSFLIFYESTGYFSLIKQFRTPPVPSLATPLKIAIGKMVSNNVEAAAMTKVLGQMNVDLVLVS